MTEIAEVTEEVDGGIQDRRVVEVDGWTNFNTDDELLRSDNAHEVAKRDIYPKLFTPCDHRGIAPRGELIYTNGIQDGGKALEEDRSEGIDTTIWWKADRYGDRQIATPITTIQERSRHPKFSGFGDLTLTYINPTGVVGDFFKCRAEFYLYGFFDLEKKRFDSAYLIQKSGLFRFIIGHRKGVQVQTNDKGQEFLAVKLNTLRDAGIIKWEQLSDSQEKFLDTLAYQMQAI